ncbi:MAG: thioredoxin family protein [Phycisphaerae bacterium]|nr:thioredoxin family protein [Phycisphaerae bacterium]
MPAVAVGAAPAPAPKESEAAAPPAQLDWRSSLDAALKEAADSGRAVLVYFRADWSQPCELVDRGCFGNLPMVTYISRHFVPVRVDDTEETSETSRRFGIRVYPSVLFLLPSGEPLHLVLGPRVPKEFLGILNQVRLVPDLIRVQKEKPDDVEANFALGHAFAMLDQLKRAAPYLERVMRLDPENRQGHRTQAALILAMVPLEDGDSAATLENLTMYLLDYPQAPEIPTAMYYVGTVLYGDGRLAEAREAFDRLRQEYPRHVMAYKADKAIEAIDMRLRVQEVEKQRGEDYNQTKEPEPEG